MEISRRPLSAEIIERLNACMRPSDSIKTPKLAIVLALLRELDALEDDDLRLSAFIHIFDAYGFAYFSGPQTPVAEFPDFPQPRGAAERAYMEALGPLDLRELNFAAAQLAAGFDPSPTLSRSVLETVIVQKVPQYHDDDLACARYALRRLSEETSRQRRVGFLAFMLGSSVFCPKSRPPMLPWSDPTIDDAYHHDALLRHHVSTCNVIACLPVTGEVFYSNPRIGGTVLNALSRVGDPRDRACVLGFVIEQWKTLSLTELQTKYGVRATSREPWDDSIIDETDYERALWRNRAIIREALWCLPGVGSYNTPTPQVGGMLYDVLSRISDFHDRACVLGFIFEQWWNSSPSALCGRHGVPVSVDIIPKPRDPALS
ncbi:MAG: hypothetical protein ABIG71_03890 [Candidatus Uhrbacteria bacterium]